MTLDLNIANLSALAVVFVGALWTLLKVFASQYEKALEGRFRTLTEDLVSIKNAQQKEQETNQRLERELMNFKAELPLVYVRRDDFVRAQGTIEAKIDNMALRIERMFMNFKGPSAP